MRSILFAGIAVPALLFAAGTAQAQDRTPCGVGLVCASNPDAVMKAMEKAGLKPKKSTDNDGDPMIESDAATYHFQVYFYGCEQHRNCDSLRFEVAFRKEPDNTAELANKWNANQRFIHLGVKPDGRMVAAYDLAMIGGTTERNFADVLDWWKSQLEEMALFFDKEAKPAEAGTKVK